MHNDKVIYYAIRWANESLEHDLDAVYAQDEADGLYVDTLFDVLEDSAVLRAALAEGRFRRIEDPRFDANPLAWSYRSGYNLYYLKMWRTDGALVPFRLIYAVDHTPQSRSVWVLGLMERAENYDEHSDFAQRVCRDYERFGIPRVQQH